MATESGGTETVDDVEKQEKDTGMLSYDGERKLFYASCAGVLVGSLLPWATIFGQSILGIQGDGILTIAIGVVVLAGVYFRGWGKRSMLGTVVGGLVIFLIGLSSLTGAAAIGLYLTILGGMGLIAAGVHGYWRI